MSNGTWTKDYFSRYYWNLYIIEDTDFLAKIGGAVTMNHGPETGERQNQAATIHARRTPAEIRTMN